MSTIGPIRLNTIALLNQAFRLCPFSLPAFFQIFLTCM